MHTYEYLIDQTFDFPTSEFRVENDSLIFNNIDLMPYIKKYGTPLKLSYLPKISQKIQYAKKMFNYKMLELGYHANYTYCYCTKASHFRFVIEEVLKNDVELETSSSFDIELIKRLYQNNFIKKDRYILCNGFKNLEYMNGIVELIQSGFTNCVPIIDHVGELDFYESKLKQRNKIGIRIAADEEPQFGFYTSRLGVRYNQVIDFVKERIQGNKLFELKLIHFFINTGIRDTQYYWYELNKFLDTYCTLKKICLELDSIDIGGGLPIKTSLASKFDHEYLIEQILQTIRYKCHKEKVAEPHIFTEFGNYTVGESGALIYSVDDIKQQNDKELWYMIDGSFITQLPDTWAKNQKFILLAINNWKTEYQKVHLGGITCDSDDYYNSEVHSADVYLPKISGHKQYIGFFHTGAYQDNLCGSGGIHHCLIPGPKHVVINRDENGIMHDVLFQKQQSAEQMMHILGF